MSMFERTHDLHTRVHHKPFIITHHNYGHDVIFLGDNEPAAKEAIRWNHTEKLFKEKFELIFVVRIMLKRLYDLIIVIVSLKTLLSNSKVKRNFVFDIFPWCERVRERD